ncbi:MAG: hypothetical protein IKQ99_03440, partial [Alphaproteobacteria bacterium]|nr:hypothetical protein [Alphaproteobacteria bacterium]
FMTPVPDDFLRYNGEVWQMDGKTFKDRGELGMYLMEQKGYGYNPSTGQFVCPYADQIARSAPLMFSPEEMDRSPYAKPVDPITRFQQQYPASELSLPEKPIILTPGSFSGFQDPVNELARRLDPPPLGHTTSDLNYNGVFIPAGTKIIYDDHDGPPKVIRLDNPIDTTPKQPSETPQIFTNNSTVPAPKTTTSSESTSFGKKYSPLKVLYDAVITDFSKARVVVYVFSCFGLIAVALMAIFGKLRLQWLVTITVSLFLLASTEGIIEYMFSAGTGKTPASLTAEKVQNIFNKDNSGKLSLRDDSADFDYKKMKANEVKSEEIIVTAASKNFNFVTEQQKWKKQQEALNLKDAYGEPIFTPTTNVPLIPPKEKMFFGSFQTLLKTFVNLRIIVYVLSGFALVGLAFMAIMGKLDWALFSVIAISLFVLSGTEALVAYAFNAGGGNATQMTADSVNKRFNQGDPPGRLQLRDDSKDFDFLKSGNKRETPVKTKDQVKRPSWAG